MALKFFAATDTDPGEWFVWREEGADKLEVRVRRLPPAEAQRIDAKHYGRKNRFSTHKGELVQERDKASARAARYESAAFCMVETRGFQFEIATPESAARLSGLLSSPVVLGDIVTFDGKWTDALKEYVFAAVPTLPIWIEKKADDLNRLDYVAEEEASGN